MDAPFSFSVLDYSNNQDKSVFFPFFKDGLPLSDCPVCGMTLRKSGTMRFRWNEVNENRNITLQQLAGNRSVVPVELIHSKTVYDVNNKADTKNLTGDGIITRNRTLMPVVTVADCMPLYLFNRKTGVFGIVHSGWKGTGIIKEAVDMAIKNYGGSIEDFFVVLGPHIKDCCYIVNEERAEYFSKNFTPDCVKKLEEGGKCYAGGRGLAVVWNNGNGPLYRLSLKIANLGVLKSLNIPFSNIAVSRDCTCCNELFGSNRRETAMEIKDTGKDFSSQADKSQFTAPFTVQAAFIKF